MTGSPGCASDRLGPEDRAPDADTLWDFREALIRAGALDDLFAALDRAISAAGHLPHGGQTVGATLVAAPRQHLTDAENAEVKAGRSAAEVWPAGGRPRRIRGTSTRAGRLQRSRARARPGGAEPTALAVPLFGHKLHVSIDRMHGLIRRQLATCAARHDGRRLRERLIQRGPRRPRRLGRQRLPLGRGRGLAHRARDDQPYPPPPAAWPADAKTHPPRQRPPRGRALEDRARFRPLEGAHGPHRPHRRPAPGPSAGRDHARQHGPQHDAVALARGPSRARPTRTGATTAPRRRSARPDRQARRRPNRPALTQNSHPRSPIAGLPEASNLPRRSCRSSVRMPRRTRRREPKADNGSTDAAGSLGHTLSESPQASKHQATVQPDSTSSPTGRGLSAHRSPPNTTPATIDGT